MCNLLHAIIACNLLHAINCTCNHGFIVLGCSATASAARMTSNESDVTMIIAGDWRHVATGCNALVNFNILNISNWHYNFWCKPHCRSIQSRHRTEFVTWILLVTSVCRGRADCGANISRWSTDDVLTLDWSCSAGMQRERCNGLYTDPWWVWVSVISVRVYCQRVKQVCVHTEEKDRKNWHVCYLQWRGPCLSRVCCTRYNVVPRRAYVPSLTLSMVLE